MANLKNIEARIKKLVTCSDNNLNLYVEELLNEICKTLNISTSGNPISALFNDRTSERQKQFIAGCMLRALSQKIDLFSGKKNVSIRNKVVDLFDLTLFDIYDEYRLSVDIDNEEKFTKLYDVESNVLNKARSIQQSIDESNTDQIKNKIFQFLFASKASSFLVSQFANEIILDKTRIQRLLSLFEEYKSSTTIENILEAYQKIIKDYQYIIDEASEESEFSQLCIAEIFKKILDIVKSDYAQRDDIRPTELSLRIVDKKYPLHVQNQQLNIEIEVENIGTGKAFDVVINLDVDNTSIELKKDYINIGNLEPREISKYIFNAILVNPQTNEEIVLANVAWRNCDNSESTTNLEGFLIGQNTSIDWEQLSRKKPYILEAVSKEDDLVGRSELLKQLENKLLSKPLESSIIFGQKRVGKTSIAKIIKKKLSHNKNFCVLYFSTGEIDKTSPKKFLKNLGECIYEDIKNDLFFQNKLIPEVDFEDSITPLIRFFKNLIRLDPDKCFVIIIDEFDEIPSELYKITDIGDNFFHNLRSLSSIDEIALILVGGENMQTINQSTDKLNKFQSFSVDYFNKDIYWNDFYDLVCKPVEGAIEFSHESINKIYEITEGNPFYTKLICKDIFDKACEIRNAYVDLGNVTQALQKNTLTLQSNNFNHFWKDGIKSTEPTEIDEIETSRRKFLISYANLCRTKENTSKVNLIKKNLLNEAKASQIFESFINRKILVEDSNQYRLKPQIFNDWIINEGFQIVTAEALDEQAIEEQRTLEQNAYIRDLEIYSLWEKWEKPLYRAQSIDAGKIRLWLDQFETNLEQRIVFNLLENFTFYSELVVRKKLEIVHEEVRKGLLTKIEGREKKSRSILLSAFGNPAQSGSSYIRLYASVNSIYRGSDNVSIGEIEKAINQEERIKKVVFIEDIIGSGTTVCEGLEQLKSSCGNLLSDKKIEIFVGSICALEEGINKIREFTSDFSFNVKVFSCDILTEKDKCLSEYSTIFRNAEERKKAKDLIYKYGNILYKINPYGYNNSQLLIAFYETCPNNTLPIFWSDKGNWKPLFKRQ